MGLPLAPSNLAAEAVSARQINLTFTDNSEAVAGVNEVQRIPWSAPPESGTFTLTFDEETTAAIDWDASAATVQAALEATAAFEVGDITVSSITDGYEFTFTGGLAAMNVDPISVDATNLRTAADTITITVTQTGIANVTVTPSIETITNNVGPQNEVQKISMGGATSGDIDLNGNGTSANTELNVSSVQTACNTIWGSGNTYVSDVGGDINIEFQGSLSATPIPEMTFTNNNTNGTPSISTYTQGVTGVHQVDEITFTGTATAGSCTIDGDSCGYATSAASAVTVTGATVSATTPASGSITITWDSDYSSHVPVSVSADTLRIEGRPEIFTVELPEEPTEGNFYLKKDGSGDTLIYFDDDSTDVTTALGAAQHNYTASGGPLPGVLTITSDTNVASPTWTAHEYTALRKGVSATVTTVTQGAPQEWAELGFIIERSPDGEDWEELVDLGANMESWPDDDSLTALTEYFYRVNAYNGDGSSDWSNTASAMTLAGGNAIAFTSVF
jgi:hypothetical protein